MMNSRSLLGPSGWLVVLCLIAGGSVAQEIERTMRSAIIGSQEQPQMLFLIPWKEVDGVDGLRNEFSTDLNVLFDLVERESFVRELRYRDMVVTRGNAQAP